MTNEKIKKGEPLKLIDPQEHPFEVPSSWNWIRLGNITNLLNGKAYKKEELLNDDNLTPVLRVGNFFTNKNWYYSDIKLEENKYADFGDLLYAWSASFGPKIWEGSKVIYHYHIWKLLLFSKESKEYIYYFLLNDANRIKSKTSGSTMIHITKTQMERLIMPLPPIQEQLRIVQKIKKIFKMIDFIESELKAFDELANQLDKKILELAMREN